jgi:outer membrane protein TolC
MKNKRTAARPHGRTDVRLLVLVLAILPSSRLAVLQAQQPPLRLTLAEAVRRATERGEEVRLAQSSVSDAHAQVVQARADAMPQVRLGMTYQRTFASPLRSSTTGSSLPPFAPDTSLPVDQRLKYLEDEYPNAVQRGLSGLFSNSSFGAANTWTGNMTVSQLLFQGNKVGAGLRGARAFERGAREQLEETRQDISYRTRQAYLNALYAERLVAIAEGGKALSEEQLRRVELNQRVGGAADYDLLRAQVEAANQEPVVIAARNDRDIAMLQLRALVNVPPETPIELDATVLASADTTTEVDWEAIRSLAATRAAIAVAEANVEVRRQVVTYYRGDLWPALRFNLYLGAQAYPSGFTPQTWRKDWNAAMSVSWPIFEGFRTRGQISQARAQLDQAELQLAQQREAVSLEVDRARAELMRARALLTARRQTVIQATRAQHLASVRFANGIATPLEVSDARLALQQAQLNEAQATRDYLVGMAAMEKALGRPVPIRAVVQRAAMDGRQSTGGAGLNPQGQR